MKTSSNLFLKRALVVMSLCIVFGYFIVTATTATVALAAEGEESHELKYVPLAPLPGVNEGAGPTPDGKPVGEAVDIVEYAQGIFKLGIGLAAALAVIMITIGGVEYIGSDTITSKESGREKINHALTGLFIAMGAWLILYTVSPKLVSLNFLIAPIPESTDSADEAANEAMREAKKQDFHGLQSYQDLLRGLPENAYYKIKHCIVGQENRVVDTVARSFPYESASGMQNAKYLCETTPPIQPEYPGNYTSCNYVCFSQNDIRQRMNEYASDIGETQQDLNDVPKDRPDVPGWYFGYSYSRAGQAIDSDPRYLGPMEEARCQELARAGENAIPEYHITFSWCKEYTEDEILNR